MSAKKNTPLDLEHNLFERSFGSRELLDANQPEYNIGANTDDRASLLHSGAASKNSSNSLLMGHSSASASSGGIEIKPKTFLGVADPENADGVPGNPEANTPAGRKAESNDTNKHNLKLQNFQNVKSERLPGLTPPLFTPGGPRLPPIHPLPGVPLGSPGTPGSNMWSSLLNVTNGNSNTHDQYGHSNGNPYSSMVRKVSGLNPNESHLRSGLTPGGVNHNGFNFMLSNIPDGLGNGQVTPGLLTLLGLAGTSATNINEAQVQSGPNYPPQQPMQATYPAYAPTNGQIPVMPVAPQTVNTVKSEDTGSVRAKGNKSPVPNKLKEKPKNGSKRSTETDHENTRKAAKTSGKPAAKEEPRPLDTAESPNEEEKRKQFLERNRVAASKCRQRKKQLFSKMESELSYYSKGFREVSAQVTQLRDQLMTLRGILLSHKDCPGLSNAAGGYQQFQNILAQTDYMAQVSNTSESNYTSMPSTVPTTLNTGIHQAKPMDTQPRGEMFPADATNQSRGPTGMGPMVQPAINGGQSVMHQGIGDRVQYDHELPLSRQEGNVAQDVFDGIQSMPNKENLRSINSASNLQNMKMNQSTSNGLRPISSMADMQLQNPPSNQGVFPKQFQL